VHHYQALIIVHLLPRDNDYSCDRRRQEVASELEEGHVDLAREAWQKRRQRQCTTSDCGGERHGECLWRSRVPDVGEGELSQVGTHDEGKSKGDVPLEHSGIQLHRAS
jgi:hypothetical protein